ncbi:hypothetical protein [Mesorhizobium sp. CAU 1732]|uniref:hypothetical protein n=1 Tax=Mesorhizobium sp. CAU 1732 TaxID=3140358 RepID=UPI0032616049
MRSILAVLAFVAGPSGAMASGGISCEVVDDGAEIVIGGGMTRGMGSALFSFSASTTILDATVEDDLRRTEFERGHLPQYWFDGETLKLRLYREREGDAPHGYVEMLVETALNETTSTFAGTYAISTYNMTGASGGEARKTETAGEIVCSVE